MYGVTVYLVIGPPPSSAGVFQLTEAWPEATAANTPVGEVGGPEGGVGAKVTST